MKIGIIVHSYSGNTYYVAQMIREMLLKGGHQAEIERIKILGGEKPNSRHFEIEAPKDSSMYETFVFGAPVRGFSISPVIETYLNQISTLKDKKVACFVTKQLSSNWTGGKRAIAAMKDVCESKGGTVVGTGVLFWKSKNREKEIEELAEELCKALV